MSRPAQITFLSCVASAYDPVVWLMGFPALWDTIADLVDPKPGQRVLDVCTGTGGTALALARRGARVVGLDLSSGMIERAIRKRNGGGVRGRPNPIFLQMDARRLAFSDSSFPIVTCSMALHEMGEEERSTVLGEIRRVTSHRATIAEYRLPRGRLAALLFRARRFFEYIESDDFENFVRRDFGERLREAGFTVESPRDIGPYRIWPCRVKKP